MRKNRFLALQKMAEQKKNEAMNNANNAGAAPPGPPPPMMQPDMHDDRQAMPKQTVRHSTNRLGGPVRQGG